MILVLLGSNNLIAQVEVVSRFEKEHKTNDSDYIVIPLEENGIALLRSKDKFKEGNQFWDLIILDNSLSEIWNTELEVELRNKLIGYEFKNKYIYLLYRLGDHDGSDLFIITINTDTKEIRDHTIKQEFTFKVTHLGALENVILLGGYANKEPAILIFDLTTENLKVVPGFFISNTELLDLRTNSNNTFNTLIIDHKIKDQKKLILRTFDVTGAMLLEDAIEVDGKHTILSGITSSLLGDELLIVGTWTIGVSKSASGIYSVLVDPFSNQPIRYYDFGQLQHFVDYEGPRRSNKIKQKSLEARGANDVPDFKAYTSLIRLEENNEGFALLGEVFQPSGNVNSNPYWNDYYTPYYYGGYPSYGYYPNMFRYYNRPYQYYSGPNQNSDSKILQSSVILFDLNGNLKHDFNFVLDEKKTNGVEQVSDFNINHDKVVVAYKKEKEIIVMEAIEDEDLKSFNLTTLLPDQLEMIRYDSEESYIRNWYSNYMCSWGYQRLKEADSSEGARNVFYILKIRIE